MQKTIDDWIESDIIKEAKKEVRKREYQTMPGIKKGGNFSYEVKKQY